jgi:D-tyrosyl-tRNA(Tyr) deacylase
MLSEHRSDDRSPDKSEGGETQSMRAVVQRVTEASVSVDEQICGAIQRGLMVLVGMNSEDSQRDLIWMAEKIAGLRVFEDSEGKMNLSLRDVGGAVLLVSQFTLFGDCRKGRRPSFIAAARPEKARELYSSLTAELKGLGVPVETGIFQADMKVHLVNDGPVTLLLDSSGQF